MRMVLWTIFSFVFLGFVSTIVLGFIGPIYAARQELHIGNLQVLIISVLTLLGTLIAVHNRWGLFGVVACTIGLAQKLLGADRADVPSTLSAQRELPRWLVPAVLRQWSRSLSPNYRAPAVPALLRQIGAWKELAEDIYLRWDQPVRATVALHRRFNDWPQWPYQLGELLLHSSEVPKQLATMLRGQLRDRKERATEAQSRRERDRTSRTNETTGEASEAWRALPFGS